MIIIQRKAIKQQSQQKQQESQQQQQHPRTNTIENLFKSTKKLFAYKVIKKFASHLWLLF